jgi:hypothetical protein
MFTYLCTDQYGYVNGVLKTIPSVRSCLADALLPATSWISCKMASAFTW